MASPGDPPSATTAMSSSGVASGSISSAPRSPTVHPSRNRSVTLRGSKPSRVNSMVMTVSVMPASSKAPNSSVRPMSSSAGICTVTPATGSPVPAVTIAPRSTRSCASADAANAAMPKNASATEPLLRNTAILQDPAAGAAG